MDIVYIQGLKVTTLIGVYEWEQQQVQQLSLDVELATDCQQIAQEDDLNTALDYAAISKELRHFIANSHYQLIESLAEAIAQFLFANFKITWLRLNLRKPTAVAEAETVGVKIERCIN